MANENQPQGRGRQLQGTDVDAPGQQGVRSVREGDPANTPASGTDQQTQEYRMKSDAPSTWVNGELKNAGDTVMLTEQQARAGSQFFETTDGKPIPNEKQILPGDEQRSTLNLSGMARHERIDALEQEEKRLNARLEHVRSMLSTEREQAGFGGEQAKTQEQQRPQRRPGEPAPPAAIEGQTR